MNKEMGPPDLLRNAATQVARALVKLDTSTQACPTCGRRQFANKADAKVFEALRDTSMRLKAAADTLEGK